jgi:DNA repair photolyase
MNYKMKQPTKGRGAQINPSNRFEVNEYDSSSEYLDEIEEENIRTEYIEVYPKTIISKNESPDVPSPFSINPYQGCEHGCAYCYARNSHEYWGYNMGQDFESKILVKKNAPELLRTELSKKSWKPAPIMLSGNTDCYQPIERKLGITRKVLEVFLQFGNPLGVITKNALITRDIDILQELASKSLVKAALSINTIDEGLRSKLEPRTSSVKNRFRALEALSKACIHTSIMIGPVIPGLNSDHIPELIKRAADSGASDAGYIMLRLNGQLGTLFGNWLEMYYPDRKEKVLNLIRQTHGGKLNDSVYKRRMRGEGPYAEQINQLFKKTFAKEFGVVEKFEYDLSLFNGGRPKQMKFF